MNIAALLGIVESIMPDAPALIEDGQTTTYAELFSRARRVQTALEARRERPLSGSTVSTVQTVTSEHIAVLLAALQGGARANVLNYRLRGTELTSLVDEVDPHTVVVDARYRDHFAAREALAWEVAAGADDSFASVLDVPDEAPAIELFTSGTTGRPKLIPLTHGSLSAYLLNTFLPADGTPRGTTLMAVPTYHIAGLSTLLGSLYSGRTVALLGDFDAGAWLQAVGTIRPDHAFVVPTMMRRILDHPAFGDADLSSLGVVSYGSDVMPFSTIDEALRRFDPSTEFVNAYGLTEAGGTIAVLSADDHDRARSGGSKAAIQRLGSVGKAVAGVEIDVHGEDGAAAGPGELGEVVVRRSSEAPWIMTGDRGRLDDDGYLFLAGRTMDRIVRAGENIDPLEIEAAIMTMDDVVEAAVYGVPDLEWGESVAAAVVVRPGAVVEADEVRQTVSNQLASFKVPQRVHFTAELPRSAMGKIVRSKIHEQLEGSI